MDDAPLLALEDLRRTPPKALARAALQELIRNGVVSLQPLPAKRRRPRTGLVDAGGAVPSGALLRLVVTTARKAPVQVVDARAVRDLRLVAQRLAGLGSGLQDAALTDLAAAGLVERSTRKVLGVVPVTTWRRTPAGDAARARPRKHEDHHWPGDADLDASFDSGFDGGSDGGGD